MQITTKELQKIERLLESSDEANVELALTILSGFVIDDEKVNWLLDYYHRLQKIENQQNQHNLQSILLGITNTKATKASRVLTLLFEKTTAYQQLKILKTFVKNNSLTLPQLDLTSFPKKLFSLPRLEILRWQYGQLTHLTDEILKLPNLKILDLRHQPLITINEKICQHPVLNELWINNALIITEDLIEAANFEIFIEAAY